MTRHEHRETQLLRAQRAANSKAVRDQRNSGANVHHVPFDTSDELPYTDPSMHHHMSESRRHPQDIFSFSKHIPDDPATKVCSDYY